jgi:glycosyltransferase involved in cell wall biosynthesis
VSAVTIDVVIPTYENVTDLRACLEGLGGQEGVTVRALVCVDGSTDGTLDYLAATPTPFPIEVLTHPRGENRGRAATRNLALGRLASEWVVLMDSDMRPAPDCLARHVALLQSQACASVGAIDYSNLQANLWARYISARRLNRYGSGELIPYSQFTTANVGLRSADLSALGGFDERLTGYGGEDSELGYRLATELERPILANHAARASSTETKPIREALLELEEYGRTNLRLIQARHPDIRDPFGAHRIGSRRPRDLAFVAMMNPATDAIVAALLAISPFRIQEQLINYQVVRAVCRGYASSREAAAVP